MHILSANVHKLVKQSDYCWELSPHLYFLTPGQRPQMPLTNLLIINKTGEKIDDFIHSLEQQNIALEVDAFGTRNGTEDSQYNGAIIVAGGETPEKSFCYILELQLHIGMQYQEAELFPRSGGHRE